MSDQKWANLISARATDSGTSRIISAINEAGITSRADVIVACAQILAQNIVGGGQDAKEVRSGIHALIDGYAVFVAATEVD